MVTSPLFVADFATNHLGNLDLLLRMAERAAWAGCSLIGMRKTDVESCASREELDSPCEGPYGHTHRDHRTVLEFGADDFDRFDRRCRALGVGWFASARDLPSLEFLLGYDLPLYQVDASAMRDHSLLRGFARRVPRDRAIVLPVGDCTRAEIEEALAILSVHPLHLLHGVARSACPPEALRLGDLEALRRTFADERVSVGYSGHEAGLAASYAAVDLGACMVVRPFCLSRHSFAPAIECSLEPHEFKLLVDTAHEGLFLHDLYRELPPAAFAAPFGTGEAAPGPRERKAA